MPQANVEMVLWKKKRETVGPFYGCHAGFGHIVGQADGLGFGWFLQPVQIKMKKGKSALIFMNENESRAAHGRRCDAKAGRDSTD